MHEDVGKVCSPKKIDPGKEAVSLVKSMVGGSGIEPPTSAMSRRSRA